MFSIRSVPQEEFGSCPNCGGSWEWKQSGSIPIEGILGEVLICIDCLKHPERLNITRIAINLEKYEGRLHM
jgi:hypothetical protein